MYDEMGAAPPKKEEAPDGSQGARDGADRLATVYHTPPEIETIPATYPRQTLRRGRSGWVLTLLDGWGRRVSRTVATRTEALDLLAIRGTLTVAIADTHVGGAA